MEIKKIKFGSKHYPSVLTEIEEPPEQIFVRGKIPEKDFFAIVGTRRYSGYGKRAGFDIARKLTRAGLGIVSGMAEGIDTFSHKGCLAAGGRTVAVLGGGVDKDSIYPRQNLNLSERIIKQKGALVSEYPPGSEPERYHFPRRNRLISGLSCGVLVIEAKKKSGALITADWAKKQGKPLFALPGSIYSLNSFGPNRLIKEGAIPVTSSRDILKELNINKKSRQKTIAFEKEGEKAIAKALKKGETHIEDIIKQTGLAPAKVSSLLSEMEIAGKVKNIKGNTYVLTR